MDFHNTPHFIATATPAPKIPHFLSFTPIEQKNPGGRRGGSKQPVAFVPPRCPVSHHCKEIGHGTDKHGTKTLLSWFSSVRLSSTSEDRSFPSSEEGVRAPQVHSGSRADKMHQPSAAHLTPNPTQATGLEKKVALGTIMPSPPEGIPAFPGRFPIEHL